MKLNVEINFKNLNGDGFAAFLKESVSEKGIAMVVIDLNSMLNCCSENHEIQFKEVFKESVLHEILHGIEELFNQSFDEDRIEDAILKSRNLSEDFTDYELKIMEQFNNLVSDTYFEGELTITQIKRISDKVFTDSQKAIKFVNKKKNRSTKL